MEILAQNPTEKFLLLQSLESYLQKTGLSPAGASAFTLLATFAVLALLVWVLDRLGTKVLLGLIRHAVSKTETLWDDHLLRHKFFPRLIELATASGLLALVRTVFSGYGPALIGAIRLVLRVYMTVVGALMIGALLNTVNDIYESKPQSRRKSIRGYIQTAKIVVWIIAGILIVSILIGRDPTDLLLGLGASAALVSLEFKDTILCFVASIQLSAQDMIRPGDWIEMPSKGADGVVSEINVNSVKVRNWDNTMTMIPIYSLVSESFTNWRNMEESAGRRFKRPLRIDATTVSTLSEEQLTALTADPRIAELAEAMLILDRQTGTSPCRTNSPACSAAMPRFIWPDIRKSCTLVMARYLPWDENGLTLEIYGSLDRKIVSGLRASGSHLLNHLLAVMLAFGLRLYQWPAAPPPPSPEAFRQQTFPARAGSELLWLDTVSGQRAGSRWRPSP